jgi:alpha-amylase/alpha-mannosidase (GH57 family)
MNSYFSFFLHFYQPDRIDPRTGKIGLQESAHPFTNWNRRIAHECYRPNTAVNILDGNGHTKTINNFEHVNFDIGPTLMHWLMTREHEIYRAIIDADIRGRKKFNGHGTALALASYNHVILPLATRKDKITQVAWSINDFAFHYDRLPEGMWLPEAAVDLDTLDIMSEQGIKFTILSQYQAVRCRPLGSDEWRNVGDGSIDTRHPYLCRLPSGKSMAIFFYDGNISQKAAYGDILSNGDHLAHYMRSTITDACEPQITHLALDGETFGHHKKFAEKALPHCFERITKDNLGKITVYGEYLEYHPPNNEVEIRNGAWSCPHNDFGRWQRDCGCKVDQGSGWNQGWRTPLRQALDWLNDKLGRIYEKEVMGLLRDPENARNDFIKVMHDHDSSDYFFHVHAKHRLSDSEKKIILDHLNLQRSAMLMFTSCGWFFDDLTDLSTKQNICQAKWAIEQVRKLTCENLEPFFLKILEQAKSNIPGVDGRSIYENC